jgi:hypothetical protein
VSSGSRRNPLSFRRVPGGRKEKTSGHFDLPEKISKNRQKGNKSEIDSGNLKLPSFPKHP